MLSRHFVFVLMLLFVAPLYAAPRVVVSIAPIHSLVAGVMEGVTEPELLVSGNSSPHGYMLKPSQVRSLHQANLVIWVGESVEGFLPRTLANLDEHKTVIELMAAPGMKLLPAREGGVWESAHHHHGDKHHGHGETDGHLWLDPENAQMIVRVMMAQLSNMDAEHAKQYRANGEELLQGLERLDQRLKKQLAPVGNIPYLVFHDAYHYFEDAYGLNPVGAIMIDLEHKPGARRLLQIRERVQETHARCVFSEPQFPQRLVNVVIEGMEMKSGRLDPMGMDLQPGKQLYFDLMKNIGDNLKACLMGGE
jgi:zinc transport system substrate-binding protein